MSEDTLMKTLSISSSGMQAQGTRLRVIAENIANANSMATQPGALPYRRQIVTFSNELLNSSTVYAFSLSNGGSDHVAFRPGLTNAAGVALTDGAVLLPSQDARLQRVVACVEDALAQPQGGIGAVWRVATIVEGGQRAQTGAP